MEGEKIYPATPTKIKKSREEGQVPKSTELISLVVVVIALLYIYLNRTAILELMDTFLIMLSSDFQKEFSINVFGEYFKVIFKTVLPFGLSLAIGAILINYVQVGFMLTFKVIIPKLDRVNPLKGLKNMFSKDKAVEIIKGLIKVIGFLYIAFSDLKEIALEIPMKYTENAPFTWDTLFGSLFSLSMKLFAFLFVISVIDYGYKRFKFMTDLKMTHQEMKEEIKRYEGSPMVKQRQREFARTLTRRQIQKVKEATVVITNPTHFAIAIKYDPITHPVPVVLFKGVDEIAQAAKKVARENNIPMVENRPLARALYANVEEDSMVPSEYFTSISVVLDMIMTKEQRMKFSKQYKKMR